MSDHDPTVGDPGDSPDDANLLDRILGATRGAERTEDRSTVSKIVQDAMRGTPTRSLDVTKRIEEALRATEREVARQLERILHHPTFQGLEASWRGLFELVSRSETDATLKIRVLNVSREELADDLGSSPGRVGRLLNSAKDDDGAEPFDVVIADTEFRAEPADLSTLASLADLATAVNCLLIAPASASLVGLPQWSDLDEDSALGANMIDETANAWREFQTSESSLSVIMPMPRVLARLPYGSATSLVEEFPFEELEAYESVKERLLWTNPAYLVGALLTDAFSQEGRSGVNELLESGARVGRHPYFLTRDDDGDPVVNGPLEIFLDRHLDAELRAMGLTPLQAARDGDSVVINGFGTPHGI